MKSAPGQWTEQGPRSPSHVLLHYTEMYLYIQINICQFYAGLCNLLSFLLIMYFLLWGNEWSAEQLPSPTHMEMTRKKRSTKTFQVQHGNISSIRNGRISPFPIFPKLQFSPPLFCRNLWFKKKILKKILQHFCSTFS